jgi:hypothetical protein
MSKDEKGNQPKEVFGALDAFEPGGASGPIENRNEYEERLRELPPDQKQLAEESTRLADLCQYFSQRQIDIPPELVGQVGGLSKLTTSERIGALVDLNRALMEYLNGIGQDPAIRQ